jgi:hypothetical protein
MVEESLPTAREAVRGRAKPSCKRSGGGAHNLTWDPGSKHGAAEPLDPHVKPRRGSVSTRRNKVSRIYSGERSFTLANTTRLVSPSRT